MNLPTQERSQATRAKVGLGTVWNSLRQAVTVVQSSVTHFIRGAENNDNTLSSSNFSVLDQKPSDTDSSGSSSSSGGTSASVQHIIENTTRSQEYYSSTGQLEQENIDLGLNMELLPFLEQTEPQAEPNLQYMLEPQNRDLHEQRTGQHFEEQVIQDLDHATQPDSGAKQQVEPLQREAIELDQQVQPQIQPEVVKLDQLDPQIQPDIMPLNPSSHEQAVPPSLDAKTQQPQPPSLPTPAQPAPETNLNDPSAKDYELPNPEIVAKLNHLLDQKPKGKLIAETTWIASADPVMDVYHHAAAEVTRVTNFSSKHARYESLVAAKLIHTVGYNKAAEAMAAGSPKLNHINRTQGARAAAMYLQEQLYEGRQILQSVQQFQHTPQRKLRKPAF
jgi:hypothetical protein